MDQQRRMVLFLVLSFGTMYLWLNMGLPYFYPEMARKQAQQQAARKNPQADPAKPEEKQPSQPDAENAENNPTEPVAEAEQELPNFPARQITLGTLDPTAAHFMQVELTSRGAAVSRLQLNDRRYRELTDRNLPLQLLGEVPGRPQKSFDLSVAAVDQQLVKKMQTLDSIHWEVDDSTLTPNQVTFKYPAPDGTLELLKTYTLLEGDPRARDTDTKGYCLEVKLSFRNLTNTPLPLKYSLQGPVGFPLEEEENTRRFLVLQAGFVRSGSIQHEQLTAQEIVDQSGEKGGIEALNAPIGFIGVDGQYFATLIVPKEDQEKDRWIEQAQPQLMFRARTEGHSLISLALDSTTLEIPAGETLSHEYTLFAGPKRTALLTPLSAESIIEYGWFGAISRIMLAIMNFFHKTLYLPYGLAIVMLTVIVRGLMYPISRRHALAAKRMKEMQPRFEEIRKKYENDKEKLAKAQMELMRESGFFSGCLPMLLQLPIFIGLYQALYVSVDLRMAEFLWIDNLAAPDRLFRMPFSIPFLGNDFNLLPMITVALFVVQQKLFAPPPANEEQALQQKMMSYMMIFIGVMFYRVPAGLCVYFIASSLWAIAERKILDFHDTSSTRAAQKKEEKTQLIVKGEVVQPKKPSWLQNMMSALDAAANPANKGGSNKSGTGKKNKPNSNKS